MSASAIPTLKVMRLQAPQLGQPSSGALLSATHLLSSTLLLPDSFGVIHVGETFSAYLGVLNASADMSVRGLTVSSQLQTPSRRIPLPSRLDDDNAPCDVEPRGGVDAVVSRRLEEAGPHILRVEVGYASHGAKSLRKFYRFNVTVPLKITETVTRGGDAWCLVSVAVENVMEKQGNGGGAVAIGSVAFEPTSGLVAERIRLEGDRPTSALQLFDECGRLEPGECCCYLFSVEAKSEAAALRGIAFGDDLGQAVLTYHKAMGETGLLYGDVMVCPPTLFAPPDQGASGGGAAEPFVVHRSGLSVDVTAAAAQRSGRRNNGNGLDETLPVTVEPLAPPRTMDVAVPAAVSLLVVNHSGQPRNLQLQMRVGDMAGVVVCGSSYQQLGELPPSGGSRTVDVRLVALAAGLFSVRGCVVVDLSSGVELKQPALFDVFVELPTVAEEKSGRD